MSGFENFVFRRPPADDTDRNWDRGLRRYRPSALFSGDRPLSRPRVARTAVPQPSACEPLAKQYGGTVYPDLDGLLRASEVEAVIIATPHPTHADLAIRCLEAGKHVLCEKPMATSLADAVRIEQAAARSRRVFMALPFDRSPAVEEAKRLIDSGAIGRVSMADAALAHRGPGHAPWFFDAEKAHWGVLADLGVYLISQLTYLFGPAEAVRGKVDTIIPERQGQDGKPIAVTVDDNAAALLELPGAF